GVEARVEAGLATSTDPEAAHALAALSERIEELTRDRRHQAELIAKLDELESRIQAETVTAAELTAAVAELRDQQPSVPDVSPQLEELQLRVDELVEKAATAAQVPSDLD